MNISQRTCGLSAQAIASLVHVPDLADIFKYANVGVRISAGMVAHNGTRFGEFGKPFDTASISCTVSSDGCMLNYKAISILCHLRFSVTDALEEPFRTDM